MAVIFAYKQKPPEVLIPPEVAEYARANGLSTESLVENFKRSVPVRSSKGNRRYREWLFTVMPAVTPIITKLIKLPSATEPLYDSETPLTVLRNAPVASYTPRPERSAPDIIPMPHSRLPLKAALPELRLGPGEFVVWEECEACDGKGRTRASTAECPDCRGEGEVRMVRRQTKAVRS